MKRLIAAIAMSMIMATVAFAQYAEVKTVRVGETLTITLQVADPGFHWEVEQQPDGRLLLTGEPKIIPSRVGRPGSETWIFSAPFPGKVNLIFKYVGPNKNPGPLSKRVYQVIIQEKSGRY